MESITVSLILLLAVVVSGTAARMLPFAIPLPLVQIGIGVLIAGVAQLGVTLDPDIFFLLFLPPLLFLDGWRIPKEGLLRDWAIITALAFGLVVFTVLGVGLFIHWLIPAMPLAVAFALAAALSPTDPVAVSAITARVPVPRRLMHILEGESLLNDASGLVCMRFAVALMLTGAFSLPDAVAAFSWLTIAGIGIGIGCTWVAITAKDAISKRLGEEPASQILISLLIPFGTYLLAEHAGGSGILAAVASGVTMSLVEQRSERLALTRIQRTAVWDNIRFTLNGIVFILLGEQLPRLIEGAATAVTEAGRHDPRWLIVYVVAINIALAALRFLWVWISLRFTLYRARRHGMPVESPSWRLIGVMSLAGIRGAVTLAGILTLPLTMGDGSPFPARDLAILLAAGVIVASMLGASIGLPVLLRGVDLPPENPRNRLEDDVRVAAAKAAIAAIERYPRHPGAAGIDDGLIAEVGSRLIDLYQARIEDYAGAAEDPEHATVVGKIEREMRLHAIQAERAEIFRLDRERTMPHELAQKLVRETDLREVRFR